MDRQDRDIDRVRIFRLYAAHLAGFGLEGRGMKNISIKRLATLMVITTIAVSTPAMQSAFAQPVPPEAGFGEITARFEHAMVNSVNALIPAWISALVGFFTRADKTEPLFALKGGR